MSTASIYQTKLIITCFFNDFLVNKLFLERHLCVFCLEPLNYKYFFFYFYCHNFSGFLKALPEGQIVSTNCGCRFVFFFFIGSLLVFVVFFFSSFFVFYGGFVFCFLFGFVFFFLVVFFFKPICTFTLICARIFRFTLLSN